MLPALKTVALLVLLVAPLDEPDVRKLSAKAGAAYGAKDYAEAAALYERALAAGASKARDGYNAACCYALLGKKEEAFRWLRAAIDDGFTNLPHIKGDTDLTVLHDDPRWKELLAAAEKKEAERVAKLTHPDLRKELLERMEKDQAVRRNPEPDVQEMMKIDRDNTAWLKEVIAEHGWPTYAMVGKDGALAAFLIVQHGVGELAFQLECLKRMETAAKDGQASKTHAAYLMDRTRLAQGKKQLYGTQLASGPDGELIVSPIEDEANVDKRRAEVGLGPLADYVAQVRGMQGE